MFAQVDDMKTWQNIIQKRNFQEFGISIGFFYQIDKENIISKENKSISKVLVTPMSEHEVRICIRCSNYFKRE